MSRDSSAHVYVRRALAAVYAREQFIALAREFKADDFQPRLIRQAVRMARAYNRALLRVLNQSLHAAAIHEYDAPEPSVALQRLRRAHRLAPDRRRRLDSGERGERRGP